MHLRVKTAATTLSIGEKLATARVPMMPKGCLAKQRCGAATKMELVPQVDDREVPENRDSRETIPDYKNSDRL